MISNCGSDERGKYSGGQAGDQTGGEWRLRTWYNRPWNCVLRHPDPNVRKMISQMATAAANNNNIGYDQSQRLTFWNHLVASNYDPAQITVKCEADCSSGVAAICKAVGYRLRIQALKNISTSIYTGNQRAALKAAGFQVLTASKYLTTDAYLLAGDILLNESAHTAINVTNGSKSGGENSGSSVASNTQSVPAPSAKPSGTVMKNIQSWINAYCNAGLVVDGDFGPKTKKGLCKALQHCLNTEFNAGLAEDGSFGPKTKAACGSARSSKTLTYIAQAMLYAYGYNMSHSISRNDLDKSYGPGMKNTVKQFQSNKGLSADGDCGPNTFAAMFA